MNKLNLLITCNLHENVVVNHITPLSKLDLVNKIDLIKDKKGVPIEKVNYIYSKRFYKHFKFFQKLYLLIKQIFNKKYDVLIAFYLVPHGINHILIEKLIRRKKVIICLIGTDINKYLKSFYSFILLKILNLADYVTVTGNSSKEILVREGINKDKIVILPNAVDTNKFKPSSSTKKEYDIAYVGRLNKIKKVDLILNVLNKVVIKLPNIKIVIVGDGPLKSSLERLAKKLNLENNISFIGYQRDVLPFLRKSKIFIMASENEGLPFSLIEAMCCGVVPIAPDVGDISDVANINNSILIKNRLNVNEYAKAVIKLITNKNLYNKLSKNSQKIRHFYSFNDVIKIWYNLLK